MRASYVLCKDRYSANVAYKKTKTILIVTAKRETFICFGSGFNVKTQIAGANTSNNALYKIVTRNDFKVLFTCYPKLSMNKSIFCCEPTINRIKSTALVISIAPSMDAFSCGNTANRHSNLAQIAVKKGVVTLSRKRGSDLTNIHTVTDNENNTFALLVHNYGPFDVEFRVVKMHKKLYVPIATCRVQDSLAKIVHIDPDYNVFGLLALARNAVEKFKPNQKMLCNTNFNAITSTSNDWKKTRQNFRKCVDSEVSDLTKSSFKKFFITNNKIIQYIQEYQVVAENMQRPEDQINSAVNLAALACVALKSKAERVFFDAASAVTLSVVPCYCVQKLDDEMSLRITTDESSHTFETFIYKSQSGQHYFLWKPNLHSAVFFKTNTKFSDGARSSASSKKLNQLSAITTLLLMGHFQNTEADTP